MKVTKFNLVSMSLVAMMSVSSVSFAQNCEKLSSKELAEKKTEMMKESLDLSKKQAKQVYEINLNYIEAKKASMDSRPGLPKDGKHFKGEVCPQAPERPGTGFDKNCPQRPCPQAKPECKGPDGKPQMKPECGKSCPAGKPMAKPECNKPCPQVKPDCGKPCPLMRPECEKPKCDTAFMKGNPHQMKGCKPDSVTMKYHNEMKEVLTAAQYEKWMKIQCEKMKDFKGHKPMPCPKK
ncbi:MAG: hypothetical protein IKV14_08330 [Muribaculaceae bacterium]|nr:hypothetical protein [Muribaculaceae bacterium]